MSNTVVEANAGAEASPVEKKMSEQDWILRRQAAHGVPVKEAPKAEEEKPKAEAAPEGDEAKPEAEAPASDDVLSKARSGNLDDLSEEELSQLAKSLGSRAVARFGELTAKRRVAEEEAAQLRAALASKEKPAAEPIANNPYASLKTSAELDAKAREIKQSIDVLEEALDGADGLGAEDAVATGPNGEAYTKKQIRERLRMARKARDEYLPDVAQRIVKRERASAMRVALEADVRKTIPWMEDEKDERTMRYKAMIGDERLKRIEEVEPEVAAQLPSLLAHAVNSMFARKEIAIEPVKARIPPSPPSNPTGGSAASSKPEATTSKQMKELRDRAANSGKTSDWTALRTHSLSKRKTL